MMPVTTVILLFTTLFSHFTPSTQLKRPCSNGPVDIVFVLDSSNSIWHSDFDLQLEFVRGVVELLPVGPGNLDFRVGVVTYSHKVRLQFHLGYYTDKYVLKRAILRVPYLGGGTYTGDAIKYVSNTMFQERHGARASSAHIIVVITDGLSQNTTATAVEASLARYYGVELYAIGVGPGVDQNELASIASNPDDQYLFRVDDFPSLWGIKDKLAFKACGPRPQRDPADPDDRSDTGPEIVLPPELPQNCGGKPAEVFFLVDASSSIWHPDFERQIDFMKHIIKIFDIGPQKTRVGVIVYSDRILNVILLDKYERKDDLLQGVDGVPYLTGGTDTAGAISYLREHGFSRSVARQNVAHVGIILTDGQSQDVQNTKEQATLAHKEGIYLFAIGIGGNVDKTELRDIANDPDENFVFMLDNFEALTSIQDILAIKTCDVEPPMQQDQACNSNSKTEVIFAFNQNDLTSDESQILFDFISALALDLNVGQDSARVGLFLNDSPHTTAIHLSEHTNEKSFAEDVGRLRIPKLAHLLQKIRHHSFSGGRENVPKLAVLFVKNKLDKHRHALREAHRLKRDDVELIVVAIGKEMDPQDMASLCSAPVTHHLVQTSGVDELWDVKEKIHQRLCDAL